MDALRGIAVSLHCWQGDDVGGFENDQGLTGGGIQATGNYRKLLCLDSGHFHPTEGIADKISSVLTYLDRILLPVSRGVRWDSDHVVILSDKVRAIAEEVLRGGYLGRVHLGLDCDGSQ
jgi:L-rhamnose isomerase